MEIEIIISGNPVPLRRPRFSKSHVYDSQAACKNIVSFEMGCKIKKYQWDPLLYLGPISIEFRFYMPIPVSLSKKKRLELVDTEHFKKPDIDNLIKFYCDAANGVVFKDDSQICELGAAKYYSTKPRTEIDIVYFKGED